MKSPLDISKTQNKVRYRIEIMVLMIMMVLIMIMMMPVMTEVAVSPVSTWPELFPAFVNIVRAAITLPANSGPAPNIGH